MKSAAAILAAQGVFIGTSSWKYESWFGQLYTPSRYEYRGKVAKTRFERDCLSEYAEVFKTVSVDAAYYTFPSTEYLQKLADAVPDDFKFGLKVTDAVTINKFPNLARFGANAGQPNPNYLNAELFAGAFLKPCEKIRAKVGVLMFEFSRFWPSDYEHGRDFVSDLDQFLGKLPKGWPYAIEMRNKHWLAPEYFGCLARHGVTHVFNSWDAMPPVSEQMAMPDSRTNPRSDCRPLSAEAWTQIRGGGENVSAVRQGEGTKPEGARGGQGANRRREKGRIGARDVHLRQQSARRQRARND